MLIVLAGCSSRTPFQSPDSRSDDKSWWQCAAKSEREWRCSDGEQVQETVDVVASQTQSTIITPDTTIDEPLIVDTPELNPEPVTTTNENVSSSSEKSVEPVIEPITSETVLPEPVSESVASSAEESLTTQGDWVIQLGAFRSEVEADKLAQQVLNARVETHDSKGVSWYRVVYGNYLNANAAKQAAIELQQQYSVNTWVRKH